MLNKSKLIYQRKQIVGGKVMHIQSMWKGGSLTRVTKFKRLGRTHIKCHGQCNEARGGSVQSKKSHSVHNSSLNFYLKEVDLLVCTHENL